MNGGIGMDIKWEIAYYLIEAKKAVDSLWYISNHVGELYDVRQLCNDRRSQYYINTCAVLDKTVCNGKGKKKELTQSDNVIAHIYYERDKHYAHKDSDYRQNYPWTNLEQEAFALQEELRHISKKCKDYLPQVLTLDFVCYDSVQYRYINNIGKSDEEKIKNEKYPFYNKPFIVNGKTIKKKPIYDIETIKSIPTDKHNEYCVIIESGLTFEEDLQNRQDALIKLNVLCGGSLWYARNETMWNECLRLRELGIFDAFGKINRERIKEEIKKGNKIL